MYGYEVGPTVYGQILTIPAAMAHEWPDEVVHLRLRDVVAQKELATIFDSLEREVKSGRSAHSRAAHYHLGLLGVYFERQMEAHAGDPRDERAASAAARLVAAYTDLIERDFHLPRGVADYAARLGVTPTHLTRCCRITCGRSAHMLLKDRVIYEARLLLRETRTPVQDIARALGFASAGLFHPRLPAAHRPDAIGVPAQPGPGRGLTARRQIAQNRHRPKPTSPGGPQPHSAYPNWLFHNHDESHL